MNRARATLENENSIAQFENYRLRYLKLTYLGCSIVEIRIKFVNDKPILPESVQTDIVGLDQCLVQNVQKSNNIQRRHHGCDKRRINASLGCFGSLHWGVIAVAWILGFPGHNSCRQPFLSILGLLKSQKFLFCATSQGKNEFFHSVPNLQGKG